MVFGLEGFEILVDLFEGLGGRGEGGLAVGGFCLDSGELVLEVEKGLFRLGEDLGHGLKLERVGVGLLILVGEQGARR